MPLQTPVRRLFRVALITGMGLAVAGCASISRNPKEGRRSSGRAQGDRSGPPQGGRGGVGGGRSRGDQNGQGGASGSRSQRPAKGGRQRISSLEAVKMEIEQNSESMGMEFDGANYRDVSWGKRKRGELTVESGWKEGDLITKSNGFLRKRPPANSGDSGTSWSALLRALAADLAGTQICVEPNRPSVELLIP